MTETHPSEVTRWLHLPFPRHNRTTFIQVDTAICVACGKCVLACPQGVLGIISFLSHRHVHIDQASSCKGCRKCVKTCLRGAIQSRPRGGC